MCKSIKNKEVMITSINDIKFSLGGINYALLTEFSRFENEKYKKSVEVYNDLFHKDIFLINNNALYVNAEEPTRDLTSFWSIFNGIDRAIEWEN